MLWTLKHGKDLKIAYAIQEKMDSKGDGEVVPQLMSKPDLYKDLVYVFEAFLCIKAYCKGDFIKVIDILSYCELNYIYDFYERKQLLTYIEFLESETIKYLKANSNNIVKR